MTLEEKELYAQTLPVHVGVDAGKTFHKLVARRRGQKSTPAHKVPVGRAGCEAADAHLRALNPDVPPGKTLVGIEFAGHHGFTFAQFLAQRGYQVVNVLPHNTKRTKDVGTNSTNKSDDVDARQICRLVGQGVYVRFPLLDERYTALRLLTVHRRRLVVEGVRYRNRVQSLLDLAWPEYLTDHFADLDHRTPVAVLERWPLPADLLAAPEDEVRMLIRTVSRGHVGPARIDALLEAARTTIALTTAADVRRHELAALFRRSGTAREHLAEVDERIAALVEECPPAKALTTVPELAAAGAATIVSELGTPEDYEHPRQVLTLAGMDLSGSDSGTSVRSGRRQSKRGRPLLRRELFLLAGRWCQTRGLYRAQYEAMLARNGKKRTKAMCAIARKLVPMLLHIAQSREPFDRERWLADRRRPGQEVPSAA